MTNSSQSRNKKNYAIESYRTLMNTIVSKNPVPVKANLSIMVTNVNNNNNT